MSNPLKWRKTANGRKCRMCRCSTTWILSILPIFILEKRTDITVEFKQRAVYSEPVPMPLAAGNYRITVSYKTIGYNTVQEGKQTFNFTVTPA